MNITSSFNITRSGDYLIIEMTLASVANQGVYDTYSIVPRNWRVDIFGTSTYVKLTPVVAHAQHDNDAIFRVGQAGTTITFVWDILKDITYNLYSNIARIYVDLVDAESWDGHTFDVDTVNSGPFELDLRGTTVTSSTVTQTNIYVYAGETIRLPFRATKDETGVDFTSVQVTSIKDANNQEKLAQAVNMIKEASGSYYYDYSLPSDAVAGYWTYTVTADGTDYSYQFEVKAIETQPTASQNDCIISGYIRDLEGNPLGNKRVTVMVDTARYRSTSTQPPDYSTLVLQTDSHGHLSFSAPRQAYLVVKIQDYKTGRFQVPNSGFANINELM